MRLRVRKGKQVIHLPTRNVYGEGEEFEADSVHDLDRHYYVDVLNSETTKEEGTEKNLFDLNKEEQVKIIRQLGGRDTKIPRLEKNRVELILRLQKNKKEE